MRLTLGDVLRQLQAEGLAPAGAEDRVRATLGSAVEEELPWYLRALVGFGAWVATGFLLSFLFALDLLNGDTTRIVVGIALVGAAVWLRREATAEFFRQTAVAMSLAGQGLVITAIGEMSHSATAAGLAALALSVILIWLMPDGLHRFLSAIIGSVSALVVILDLKTWHGYELVTVALVALTAYVWRVGARDRDERLSAMLEPVGYGLIVALFGVLVFGEPHFFGEFVPEYRRGSMRVFLGPLTTIGITIAFAALVAAILDEHRTPRGSRAWLVALGGVILLGAVTLSTPGIIAGAAVLVLGFDRRNPVLIGLAAAFLLVFGSAYYYNLSLTLLEKSGVLAASGAVLLAARWLLVRRTTGEVGA